MKKRLLYCLVILVLCGIPAAVSATTYQFQAFLNGIFEVDPVTSPANGYATFVYDDVLHTLSSNVIFTGLTSSFTAAHINNADFGVNGPVAFTFSSMGSPLTDVFSLSSSQENELLAERYYVNIHSTFFPAGEIRGQITAVPEPSSLIALVGCGGAILLRRRKR